MNRNSNSRFELAPQAAIERSTFDRSTNVKTSYDVGQLIPFYWSEILPGDSVQIETSKVMRLQTLITPVMDNLYLDTYYFYVPNRILWEHWQNFCGEDTPNSWYSNPNYTIPKIQPPNGGWNVGTIADYLGLPTGLDGFQVQSLPFRAYAKICDDWFRDENLMQHLNIPLNDATISGSNGNNYVTDTVKGGSPFVACKLRDRFTSCLPEPLRGPAVPLLSGMAPVYPEELFTNIEMDKWLEKSQPLKWAESESIQPGELEYELAENSYVKVNAQGITGGITNTTQINAPLIPANLWTDLSGTLDFTINDMRQAFAVQRFLERSARGGNRYIEILLSHFHVQSPDARLQRSEYLGGNRVPLNIEQVTQTSSTDNISPLGAQAGWSQTNDVSFDVNKSFVEHGIIMGLMVARYDHAYQQGIEASWWRNTRFDYYWPEFAHLGEQPVYTHELDATFWTEKAHDWKTVFGYQEAWSEYKWQPNYITGQMRSAANGSLDAWHFADYYDDSGLESVRLSADWIKEDKANVDRTLAVKSSVANQIFGDVFIKAKFTRPMPLYSIPGLIDHF